MCFDYQRIKVVLLFYYRMKASNSINWHLFITWICLFLLKLWKFAILRHTFLKIDIWKSEMLWMNNSEETLFYKTHSLYLHYPFGFFLELGWLYWVKYCIWNNVYIKKHVTKNRKKSPFLFFDYQIINVVLLFYNRIKASNSIN